MSLRRSIVVSAFAMLIGLITGGTGRFEGASGSDDFHIVARPAAFGFDSTATFDGTISTVGSSHQLS